MIIAALFSAFLLGAIAFYLLMVFCFRVWSARNDGVCAICEKRKQLRGERSLFDSKQNGVG